MTNFIYQNEFLFAVLVLKDDGLHTVNAMGYHRKRAYLNELNTGFGIYETGTSCSNPD